MKYCDSCKILLSVDDSQYCPYCGSELINSYSNWLKDSVKKQENPEPNNKPKKTITVQEAYEWGEKFYYGKGVWKDYVKALIMYLKAAEKGHVEAQYSAGFMYYHGKGTVKDLEKAFKWLFKAAMSFLFVLR